MTVLGGCGGTTVTPEPDAEVPVPVKEAREIESGGARIQGGTVTMDVQVGHTMGQQRMSAGSVSVEGAAAVKK